MGAMRLPQNQVKLYMQFYIMRGPVLTLRRQSVVPRRRNRTLQFKWEPAYCGHACWLGKEKLGVVRRIGQASVQYAWQAGDREGLADSLKQAKALVEEAATLQQRQFSLF